MASNAAIKEAFDAFDKNKDGTISASELSNACQKLGLGSSKEMIDKVMKKGDKDCSGNLSFEEFRDLLKEIELEGVFAAFDKDGNGFITKDELKKAMEKLGEKLSDDDIKKMIDAADTNKDGKVGLEEFKKMMKSQ